MDIFHRNFRTKRSKTVLLSGFYAMDWTPGIGFRIAIVSGIPNSLSLITNFKARDSGSHKQNSPDPNCTSENFLGLQIP